MCWARNRVCKPSLKKIVQSRGAGGSRTSMSQNGPMLSLGMCGNFTGVSEEVIFRVVESKVPQRNALFANCDPREKGARPFRMESSTPQPITVFIKRWGRKTDSV